MTKPTLLVHPPLGLFEMQLAGAYDVVHWPTDRKDIRAAITIGSHGISNAIIDALPELGVIICFGVGVDGVDLDYAKQRGVAVTHGREINHEDVADVAMGLIIAVAARGDQTGLISANVIKALGQDGMLINVSRGSVVDEDALIAALKSGALGGAGLDVFATEPTPPERWADVPNTTLTPHLGGGTRESIYAGSQNVMENLRRFMAGEPLLSPVPES